MQSDFFFEPVESPPLAIRENTGWRHLALASLFRPGTTSLVLLLWFWSFFVHRGPTMLQEDNAKLVEVSFKFFFVCFLLFCYFPQASGQSDCCSVHFRSDALLVTKQIPRGQLVILHVVLHVIFQILLFFKNCIALVTRRSKYTFNLMHLSQNSS